MSASDLSQAGTWIVCEHGNRWTTAVRRFLAEIVPLPPLGSASGAHAISRVPWEDVSAVLAGRGCTVVLWEVDSANFVTACDWVTQTAIAMPRGLQLAAVSGLSRGELIVLSELGVATTVRHPEQLPSLSRMIHGHFARVV